MLSLLKAKEWDVPCQPPSNFIVRREEITTLSPRDNSLPLGTYSHGSLSQPNPSENHQVCTLLSSIKLYCHDSGLNTLWRYYFLFLPPSHLSWEKKGLNDVWTFTRATCWRISLYPVVFCRNRLFDERFPYILYCSTDNCNYYCCFGLENNNSTPFCTVCWLNC